MLHQNIGGLQRQLLFEPHTFPVNKSLYFIPQAQGRMPESAPFSRSCPFQCLLPVSLIFLPISAQIFHLLGSVFHAPSFLHSHSFSTLPRPPSSSVTIQHFTHLLPFPSILNPNHCVLPLAVLCSPLQHFSNHEK